MQSIIAWFIQVFSATTVKVISIVAVAIIGVGGVTLAVVRTNQHGDPTSNPDSEAIISNTDTQISDLESAEEATEEPVNTEQQSTPSPRPVSKPVTPKQQSGGNIPTPTPTPPSTPQYRIVVSADKCSITFYGKIGFQFSLAVSDAPNYQDAMKGAGSIDFFESLSADTVSYLTGSYPDDAMYLHGRLKDSSGSIIASMDTSASTTGCPPSNYF